MVGVWCAWLHVDVDVDGTRVFHFGAWLHVDDGSGCFPNPRDREVIAMDHLHQTQVVLASQLCQSALEAMVNELMVQA